MSILEKRGVSEHEQVFTISAYIKLPGEDKPTRYVKVVDRSSAEHILQGSEYSYAEEYKRLIEALIGNEHKECDSSGWSLTVGEMTSDYSLFRGDWKLRQKPDYWCMIREKW